MATSVQPMVVKPLKMPAERGKGGASASVRGRQLRAHLVRVHLCTHVRASLSVYGQVCISGAGRGGTAGVWRFTGVHLLHIHGCVLAHNCECKSMPGLTTNDSARTHARTHTYTHMRTRAQLLCSSSSSSNLLSPIYHASPASVSRLPAWPLPSLPAPRKPSPETHTCATKALPHHSHMCPLPLPS